MQGRSLEERKYSLGSGMLDLERILYAEQCGQPMPEELIMDDLVMEDKMCSK